MNPACDDLQVLISLRAAGALDDAEAARVEAHLAGCAACRAEAERDADVLALARLPAPSAEEARAAAEVPARLLAQLRRSERRRAGGKRIAAVAAAIAAAIAMVTAPALLGRKPAPVPEAATAAAWEEPDLDALWRETDVLELDALAASDAAAAASLHEEEP